MCLCRDDGGVALTSDPCWACTLRMTRTHRRSWRRGDRDRERPRSTRMEVQGGAELQLVRQLVRLAGARWRRDVAWRRRRARKERGERRAQRATRSGGTESGARSDARDLGPPPVALRSERDGGEWASAGGTDGDGARRGGRADARRAGVHTAARRRREKVKARARGGAGARGGEGCVEGGTA